MGQVTLYSVGRPGGRQGRPSPFPRMTTLVSDDASSTTRRRVVVRASTIRCVTALVGPGGPT